jgi:two-component system NarL family sensor kinase
MPDSAWWQDMPMVSSTLWFAIVVALVALAFVVLIRRPGRKASFLIWPNQEDSALRESEARFRHLAENMRDIAWIVSLDRRKTLFINSAFERITGRTRQSLFDQPECLDLIYAEDRAQAVLTLFRQVLEEYEGDAEFRIVRPDEGLRWLRCRAFSIVKNAGRNSQVGCIAEDITEFKQAQEELRGASARLLRLQDEERRRIARELHDSTAQMLTALMLNLSAVQKSAARLNKKARRAFSESIALARQCAQEVRTLSYLLHPPLLEELGLVSAIRNYVDGFTKRCGIQVDFEVAQDFGRLAQEIELALFRVVQESLTNIHRHSGSARARLRLMRDENTLMLEVTDEGRGMPPEMLGRNKRVLPGLGVGIAGMQERMEQLGGVLETESSRHGTLVRAILRYSPRSS